MLVPRTYCADLCLAAGEPLLGTATQVDVWLLLEYRPPWGAKALEHNDLPGTTRAWIDSVLGTFAASGAKARAQFIRQGDAAGAMHTKHGAITLFVAKAGELFRFHGESYQDIERLNLPAALAGEGQRAPALEPVAEPHYFVCANGQRDVCCARYGLPTYARLRERVGERAWQTTHVGGHRFAPNVLALPQAALYGRVFEADVAALVDAVEDGELSLPHLRGRCAYPPEAQAAEAKVPGANALLSVEGNDVTFATAHGQRTVSVQRTQTPLAVIASCGKTARETVYPFV